MTIRTGRRVCFIGGPEAGNVRMIPISAGDTVSHGDYQYFIHPLAMKGSMDVMHFAFDAQRHPMNAFVEMWREYSAAAQVKRGIDGTRTYQNLKQVQT